MARGSHRWNGVGRMRCLKSFRSHRQAFFFFIRPIKKGPTVPHHPVGGGEEGGGGFFLFRSRLGSDFSRCAPSPTPRNPCPQHKCDHRWSHNEYILRTDIEHLHTYLCITLYKWAQINSPPILSYVIILPFVANKATSQFMYVDISGRKATSRLRKNLDPGQKNKIKKPRTVNSPSFLI